MSSVPEQVQSSISGFTVNLGAQKTTPECWVGHLISRPKEFITADLGKWLMTSQWYIKQ